MRYPRTISSISGEQGLATLVEIEPGRVVLQLSTRSVNEVVELSRESERLLRVIDSGVVAPGGEVLEIFTLLGRVRCYVKCESEWTGPDMVSTSGPVTHEVSLPAHA
jgi:hypothetical protein